MAPPQQESPAADADTVAAANRRNLNTASSSFVGSSSSSSSSSSSPSSETNQREHAEDTYMTNQATKAVVVVTPYSTGVNLAKEISLKGYQIICLWNRGFAEDMKLHVPLSCTDLRYFAELEEENDSRLDDTMAAVAEAAQGRTIVAVVCGGEAGVDLADALSEHMGLLSNGTEIPNRRDKKVQQELIRAQGIRATRQAGGSEWSDVYDFLLQESYPLIVKPVDSAGSDGVKLCHSFQEAKDHFFYLRNDHALVNGGDCVNVLCQEYLRGKEYVVDHVSLNGVHKTTMVWLYDKRAVNGASFVYFAEHPVDAMSPEAQQLIPYARQVLDALGVKHGPSHGEFILTEDGPCLVEMNCRCNGGNGVWQPIAQGLTGGYDQVTAAAQCYLEPERFEALPDRPRSPFLAAGQIVDLVSYHEGIVQDTPGFRRIRYLPSFVSMETGIHPGSQVHKTIDLVTDVGEVILMHSDPIVLQQDVDCIRALEQNNVMFEFEQQEEPPMWSTAPAPYSFTMLAERKLSVPRDPQPIVFADAMPPSMYLERKLSLQKEPSDMYMER